ncbi:MAG: lysine--tRNA ligase [Planctomycetota bacterium]
MTNAQPAQSQRDVRIGKLDRLREAGFNPYHDRYDITHVLADLGALPDGTKVKVAGRLVLHRVGGGITFSTLADRSGRVQISFQKKDLPEDTITLIKKVLDIGDIIGVDGEMWTTNKGERTVNVLSVLPLSKALRPLPEKWAGLRDQEARYRQRYLDLISNQETKQRFVLRSRIVSFIRRYLDDHGFLEVETPILQAASSGAAARPFVTHHNALDRDLFLRISPETYLKRLIVGDFDRVYEIGKNFRNEGIDPSHLQEFTMLEWYAAYWNYRDNMTFVRELIQAILSEFMGGQTLTYQGVELNFAGEWPEIDYAEAIRKGTGIDINELDTREKLAPAIKAHYADIHLDDFKSYPAMVDGLYKHVIRPNLIQPSFLLHHPTEMVPLARRSDSNPRVLDMFQVLVNSWEIVKAYSELIDPIDQRARMMEQQEYAAAGDDETMMMEEDYILCMEHGMPPNSGLGLGIDRFVALLTDQESLRDVVFFPAMRNASGGEGDGTDGGESVEPAGE